MKFIWWLSLVMVLMALDAVCAYTPAETNDMVRGMLFRVVDFYSHDNFPANGRIVVRGEPPDTWERFLGQSQGGRWTTEERKAAFDWYLSTLGTNDCRALPWMEQRFVRVALSRCDVLCYTNSVHYLRALALNPRGICRDEASELYLKLSPVSDVTTSFVETIMTNVVGFSSVERGITCGIYARKACLFNSTNTVDVAAKARAVQMFYRNRRFGYEAAYLIDELFVSSIAGYAMSSNRLDTVLDMLSKMDADDLDRPDFIPITNQLLSAGQPLRQLNLDGNE